MITKELLSEVLLTVKEVTTVGKMDRSNIIWSGISVEGDLCNGSMNIHELAHKCKEWARDQGFWISTELTKHGMAVSSLGKYGSVNVLNTEVKENAPEADFINCQWILDTKG
jgi:hypothetical protein